MGSRVCLLIFIMQVVIFVYQNDIFTSQECSRALVTYVGRDNDGNKIDNSVANL